MKREQRNTQVLYRGGRPPLGGVSGRWATNGTGVLSPADSRHPGYADLPGVETEEVGLTLTPPSRYRSVLVPLDGSPFGEHALPLALGIAHREQDLIFLDAVREETVGTSPAVVVERFAETLKAYGVTKVTGDRYAGEWPREQFAKHGITYATSEKSKTEIYAAFLPILNSERARLIEAPKLEAQIVSLERRTTRGTGRDIIDHPQVKGAHDDVANAAAGAIVHVASVAKPLVVTPEQAAAFAVPSFGGRSHARDRYGSLR